jgi:hypothetical protein
MFSRKEKNVYAFEGKFMLNRGMHTIIYKAFTNPHKRFMEEDLWNRLLQ